jgi:YegS/Rv2252/BmrU family lipid kinase
VVQEPRRIHVIINPAAGRNEPILNVINSVFGQHGIEWDVSVTHKYGDATEFARKAAADGYDIVAAYGGDGTQHEAAIGILGSETKLGILPGGTGNGFANQMGTPNKLQQALELVASGENVAHVDVVQIGDGEDYFIQRLFTGIEPEQQTTREEKDKYGTFAYAIDAFKRSRDEREIDYTITIDGETLKTQAVKVYVINAAMAGTGISITGDISKVDDGLLEVFFLDAENLSTLAAAAERMLKLNTETSEKFMRQGKVITLESDPDQPVWTDGEYYGRTPVTAKVLPQVLPIIVP